MVNDKNNQTMGELPEEIACLYRHFNQHLSCSSTNTDISSIVIDKNLRQQILWFIEERMNIWRKKYQRSQHPYTNDRILQTYRFCNILRELDRQTIEYHTLLNPMRDDFSQWLLNMFYARMVARPETVRTVGLLSFDEEQNNRVYNRLLQCPKPRYGTPYVFPISTILRGDTPTRELFLTRHLPRVMERIANEISQWRQESVFAGVQKIMPLFQYNTAFLWTEVLIDVAYQYPDRVNLFAPFPIGPGSAPTFARLHGVKGAVDAAYQLGALRIPSGLLYHGQPIALSAENWEGIGCEFRKYTNLLQSKGRRRYYR